MSDPVREGSRLNRLTMRDSEGGLMGAQHSAFRPSGEPGSARSRGGQPPHRDSGAMKCLKRIFNISREPLHPMSEEGRYAKTRRESLILGAAFQLRAARARSISIRSVRRDQTLKCQISRTTPRTAALLSAQPATYAASSRPGLPIWSGGLPWIWCQW